MNIYEYFHNKKIKKRIDIKVYAEKIGITAESLSQIINGHVVPQMRTAKKIEEATEGEVTAEDVIQFCLRHKLERVTSIKRQKNLQGKVPCENLVQA